MFWYDSRRRRNRERFEAWAARGPEELPQSIPIEAIRELQRSILGSVLLPGDSGYAERARLANPRFHFHPEVIVLCVCIADVAHCLAVIRTFDITFVVRSGGHSTAGYSGSNVMILDVSGLDAVQVDPTARLASVGPGCDWGTFNKTVETFGLHLPGGACPDVCQGGYMQGGGYGFTARVFGMNCDQPQSILVMLADGRVVQASPNVNADLFWAMRGGTGNNFGVLLQTVYPLQQGDQFLGFSIGWDLSSEAARADAAQSLTWMQENFVRSVSQKLGFQMVWVFDGPVTGPMLPAFRMMGMFDGSQEDLEALLAPLLGQPGATLQYYTGPMVYSELNAYLMTTPYDVPEFPPDINPDPPAENKLSRYVARTLQPGEWLALMDYFVTSPNPYTIVAFEAYRGAIGEMDPRLNAFVHRDVDFDTFMDVFWLKPEDERQMQGFLDGWGSLIAPYWSGQVYQNYPSQGDSTYPGEYWGTDVYVALRRIKAKYDPGNRFRFPQSIPPLSPSEEGSEEAESQIHPAVGDPISYL